MIRTGDQLSIGKLLQIEYLLPIGMTATGLAERLGVPVRSIQAILDDELSIDDAMARQLAKVFHTPTGFWIDQQASYARDKRAFMDNRPIHAPIAKDISLYIKC